MKMEEMNSNLDDKSVRLLYTKKNETQKRRPQKISISWIGTQKPKNLLIVSVDP